MYAVLALLVRYVPFWAVPLAIISFETGLYYYNRRDRMPTVVCMSTAAALVLLSIVWLIFDGYWKAGLWIRAFLS